MIRTALIACAASWCALLSLAAQDTTLATPPGALVDIGGRSLHLHCLGSGEPVVLLEAGASSFAIDWSLVHRRISQTTRVCAYDRAGVGWSAPRPDVDTPLRIVTDLQRLVDAAALRPPYILVGASFGAIYVRLYALEAPTRVAGLVLVDPATEDRMFTRLEGRPILIARLSPEHVLATLPPGPYVRVPRRSPQRGIPFDRLPPALYELRVRLDERLIASVPESVSITIVRESVEGQRVALARLLDTRRATLLEDRPLVVLTRGDNQTPGLVDNHALLLQLSTNARHMIVSGAGHEIHLFAPESVAAAIEAAIHAHRSGSRLAR